jgi:hypothetical protein
MSNYVVASGEQIYQAAIAGAKRKYNRSTDDYSVYESMLHEHYEFMLNDPKKKVACARVRKRTKNNWRNARFELAIVLFHCHRAFEPCETHARVCLAGRFGAVFDIPLEFWQLFERQSTKSA